MSMLNELRAKSDQAKNKFALIFAAAITALIVGFWFLLIKNENSSDTAKSAGTSEELRPLFMIFKNAKNGFMDVKEGVKTYKASSVESNQ